MQSPYERPPTADSHRYGPDKVIGIIVIVLFGSCLLCSGISMAFGSAPAGMADGGDQQTMAGGNTVLTLVGLILIAAAVVAGVGIFLSARWGLLMGTLVSGAHILLSVTSLALGLSEMPDAEQMMEQNEEMTETFAQTLLAVGMGITVITMLVIAALFFYCLFRIIGKLGPRPV